MMYSIFKNNICRMISDNKTKECSIPIYIHEIDENYKETIKLDHYEESDEHFKQRIKEKFNIN